jgi:lipid II:glycine glycyltransferase (peptidoglycan interpeptide bridge formation enzyme)
VENNISTPVNSADWDGRQIKNSASFLQSLKWAEFQHSLGLNYYLLKDRGWSCLVFEKKNRFGKFLFAPYGPTLDSPDYLSDCLISLIKLARQVNADWLKLEPVINKGDLADLKKILKKHGAVKAVHNQEPELTRVIDLSPSDEELLASVSQSTRSLIRKNHREHFLTFQTSTQPADMSELAAMLGIVANRKGIGFFPAQYFIKQAEVLMPAKMLYLEQSYHDNKLVGLAVMHDYGPVSSYTFAATLPEAHKLSVSALLLWQALVNAKARGIKKADLWGIAPDDAPPSHPWYGFSTYKKKFGGQVVELAGTWDLPLTNKYRIYRAAQKVYRRLRRR